MKDGSSFLQVFKIYTFDYNDEIEFEKTWEDMIDTYAIHDRSWLDSIYKLKRKWAKCYMRNEFTLGVWSTQLSESLNGDLKNYLEFNLNVPNTPTIFWMLHDQFDLVSTVKKKKSPSGFVSTYIHCWVST